MAGSRANRSSKYAAVFVKPPRSGTHRDAVSWNPELLAWVLRSDYWDYHLPLFKDQSNLASSCCSKPRYFNLWRARHSSLTSSPTWSTLHLPSNSGRASGTQGRQRPVLDRLRRRQRAQEMAEVVGERMKLEPHRVGGERSAYPGSSEAAMAHPRGESLL